MGSEQMILVGACRLALAREARARQIDPQIFRSRPRLQAIHPMRSALPLERQQLHIFLPGGRQAGSLPAGMPFANRIDTSFRAPTGSIT